MDCGTGLCRADTSARRKAEDAGATPEAAAQIKHEAGLDGFRAKPERENDGKNGEHHKKNCDRARMAASADPCICSSRAKVKARHYPSRCRRLNTGFFSPVFRPQGEKRKQMSRRDRRSNKATNRRDGAGWMRSRHGDILIASVLLWRQADKGGVPSPAAPGCHS